MSETNMTPAEIMADQKMEQLQYGIKVLAAQIARLCEHRESTEEKIREDETAEIRDECTRPAIGPQCPSCKLYPEGIRSFGDWLERRLIAYLKHEKPEKAWRP